VSLTPQLHWGTRDDKKDHLLSDDVNKLRFAVVTRIKMREMKRKNPETDNMGRAIERDNTGYSL
jgi:hypothetical protein